MTGLFPLSFIPARQRRIPWMILCGYLMTFALFEVIGLPILLFTEQGDFMLLVVLFTVLDLFLIVLGIVRCSKTGGIRLPEKWIHRGCDTQALVFWVLFMALLCFELVMAYTHASYDGDDAYYVAQSVQTWQTGTMYLYIPYTGWTTQLDGRHAMAMAPMWTAYLATLCGTHPTIVAHSMLPLLLIPLADVCLYCALVQLFSDRTKEQQRRMIPAAMMVLALLQIFGNVSIYTQETFLLTRTWQGKSLFANVILPSCVVLFLWVAKGKKGNGFFYFMMVILNMASGFCTSLAPAMVTVLVLAASLLLAIWFKKGKFFISMALTCIPNYLYLVLLLRMMDSSWFSFIQGGRLP